MKKLFMQLLMLLIACCFFTSCTKESTSIGIIGGADGPTAILVSEKAENGEENMYKYEIITQEKAKEIMDSESDCIILDVREQSEYDEGHIPGAVVISYLEIAEKTEEQLPDKDALILIYCRSGRRSKIAADILACMGYSNVKEFGGIIDWKYDIIY